MAGDREEAGDHLFRLLYGLPADMQIGLARHMTARFLPVFRANHPGLIWPESVINDLDGYYREHEQGLPDEPENSCGGVPSFVFTLYALLRAWSYAQQNNLPRVTPACCTAVIHAAFARVLNVWHADDPEAVQAFNNRDREALAGRTAHHNVASQAVKKREWLLAADWLEARGVGSYPDAEDEAEREHWFEWWKDRECLL